MNATGVCCLSARRHLMHTEESPEEDRQRGSGRVERRRQRVQTAVVLLYVVNWSETRIPCGSLTLEYSGPFAIIRCEPSLCLHSAFACQCIFEISAAMCACFSVCRFFVGTCCCVRSASLFISAVCCVLIPVYASVLASSYPPKME